MKQLLILPVISILFCSCSKKSDEKDDEVPGITHTSPVNNQVFPTGQTINIQGMVTDNQYLSQVHIEITDLNSGAEYLHVHIHPATKTYAYNQTFAVEAGTSYKIKIIAEDPSANVSSKQVEISCN
ncbi:MAG TPA: DUF4625 domain-containing protein [Chitinophagaceae bacterium]|nr:DUF4625 domain-containing protein [Chitinophagaceae bacterium]